MSTGEAHDLRRMNEVEEVVAGGLQCCLGLGDLVTTSWLGKPWVGDRHLRRQAAVGSNEEEQTQLHWVV